MEKEKTPEQKEAEEDAIWERIKSQNDGIPDDDNGNDPYIPEPESDTRH